jgi:hypothetical protein
MLQNQNEKGVVALLPSSAATNADSSSDAIDTLGWHSYKINFIGAKVSATNASSLITSIKLQHSTSASSGWVDIAGSTGTTNTTAASTEFLLPTSTATTSPYNLEWNLNGVAQSINRYVRVLYRPATGNNTNAVMAYLARGDQGPSSAAEAGAWARVSL